MTRSGHKRALLSAKEGVANGRISRQVGRGTLCRGLSRKSPLYISPAIAMDVNLYAFKKRGGEVREKRLKDKKERSRFAFGVSLIAMKGHVGVS